MIANSVHRYSSTLSQGFKDWNLGNSPAGGWWADIVDTYCKQALATFSKNRNKTLRQSG